MDPAWNDRPPPPTEFAGIRLIRVSPTRDLVGIITSHKLTGCPTHYVHRRTQPCTGANCVHCLDGLQPRWHGYLSIRSPYSETQYVVELTSLAAGPVADYQDRHGDLRGARLHAKRSSPKPNSPVQTEVLPHDTDLRTLPNEVNMRKYLTMLWSVPSDGQNGQGNPHPGPNIRDTIHPSTPDDPPQTS